MYPKNMALLHAVPYFFHIAKENCGHLTGKKNLVK
jgi:hypothetical protein